MSGFSFGPVKNLILPPLGQQMRWGYWRYDTASGPVLEDYNYEQQQGMALVPQSILIDSTGVSEELVIIWDPTGIAFPITVPPNVKRALTVPAVSPVRFAVTPGAGSTGILRIDLVNFPLVPEDFTLINAAVGASVTVANPLTNPVLAAPVVAGAAVSAANPLPAVVEVGGAPVAVANPLATAPIVAGAVVSAANPLPTNVPQVGAQANAWNAVAVLAAGVSASIDTKGLAHISAFGNVSAATTIGVNVSEDNVTWYASGITQVLSAAGNFYIPLTTGARYIQLSSLDAATITATIAAKN